MDLPENALFQVVTLHGLEEARRHKRSVFCPDSQYLVKPRPAAWVINYPGSVVLHLIRRGLYVYIPKKNRKEKTDGCKR